MEIYLIFKICKLDLELITEFLISIGCLQKCEKFMIDPAVAIKMHMVKEYVGNAKQFYDHLDNCESCRQKMAEIWQHVY